jgi:mannosyltransferase OCH1-like enzyme
MIPKLTHKIWLGSNMPNEFRQYDEEFCEMNPDYAHMRWEEAALADIGFDCYEAAKRFPKPAGVSNAARLFVLRKLGGFYFDWDFKSIKPLDRLNEEGYALAAKQRDGRICNAFLAASPYHQWICYQCDRVPEYEGIAPFWGVDLASRAPADGVTILDPNTVFPFMWDDPPEKRVPHKDTIAMHLWDASWLPNKH